MAVVERKSFNSDTDKYPQNERNPFLLNEEFK